MLHSSPNASDYDEERQLAELRGVVSSTAGSAYLAEGYTAGQALNARGRWEPAG